MESGAEVKTKMMHGEADTGDEFENVSGCCCCGSFGGRQRQQHRLIGGDISDTFYLLTQHTQCQDQDQSWVMKQLYKLKKVSEFAAGPRWKTLLRKMGAYYKKKKNGRDFRYNSQDYALNFDEGDFVNNDDGDVALGFSSRFAPPARS